jgi:hypothetical protein
MDRDDPMRDETIAQDDEDDRREALPEHEFREEGAESVGGGVMGAGGTAVDRGTGTRRGTAQGPDAGRPDDPDAEFDEVGDFGARGAGPDDRGV